jgi:hypothetical protein
LAIQTALADYGKALERADARLLAEARPDLSADDREARLAPFLGALNASTDIRVLEVEYAGGDAVVTILASSVIVDGREAPRPPIEETLRFTRQGGGWQIRVRRPAGSP